MSIVNVILFSNDNTLQALIGNLVDSSEDFDFVFSDCNFSQYDKFSQELILGKGINLLFFDLSGSNEDSFEELALYFNTFSHEENIIVTVITDNVSSDFKEKVNKVGISRLLYKTQKHNEDKVAKEIKKKKEKSYICPVLSIKAGVGKTTVAFNMAKEVADYSQEKVLLIDFNDSLASLSLRLNLKFEYSFYWFMNNIESESWFEKIDKYPKSSLYVIASGFFHSQKIDLSEKNISKFFSALKKEFKYIFIVLNQKNQKTSNIIIQKSDIIYYVLEPVQEQFKSAKGFLAVLPPFQQKRIILNKYNEVKQKNLLFIFEHLMQNKIFFNLPKDVIAVSKAEQNQKSLKEVAYDKNITNAFQNLAKLIVEQD